MKSGYWLSPLISLVGFWASAQVAIPATTGQPLVVEAGPHHRVWQVMSQDDQGQTLTNSYTELATGLNYFDQETGQWLESREQFEIGADGHAVARKGQHQVIISPVINDANGAVDLLTPEGKRFRSTILGIRLFDRLTGKSVLIGQLTPSTGELIAPNQVLFRNCFDTLNADVRFTYERGAFHQDVILHEAFNQDEWAALGLSSRDCRLEIWTEFFQAPAPRITSARLQSESDPGRRSQMAAPDVVEELLDFGEMQLPLGKAYLQKNRIGYAVPVAKQWLKIKDRTFLVESIDLGTLNPLLAGLPAMRSKRPARLCAENQPPAPSLIELCTNSISIASADPLSGAEAQRGVVLDYAAFNVSQTNYHFKGDTTYYVSGRVNLYGTTTLEGGTVIKFAPTNHAGITIDSRGALKCLTSPYRPAILTARDDCSVGDTIAGSTGSPTNYYAATALDIGGNSADLKHLRIAYAQQAIVYNSSGPYAVQHCQFIHCGSATTLDLATLELRNVLINDVETVVTSGPSNLAFRVMAEFITVNGCANLANAGVSGATFEATNCVFAGVKSLSTDGNTALIGSNNGFYDTTAFGANQITTDATPFESVGGAVHYLSAASNFRNAGTTSIDPVLLSELKQRTTEAPLSFSGAITTPTTWSCRARRDTDQPDLGYHYEPLDYLINNLNLSGSLTLTNGVAVGVYGNYGLNLESGSAKITGEGSPLNLIRLTRYQTVQEQPVLLGNRPVALIYVGNAGSGLPGVSLRFTDVPALAGGSNDGSRKFIDNASRAMAVSGLSDCQLRGSTILASASDGSGPVILALTNNLLERASVVITRRDDSAPVIVSMRNNLFWQGGIDLWYDSFTGTDNPYWEIHDNLFDQCRITEGGTNYASYILNSFNGYVGTGKILDGSGGHDQMVSTFDYTSGPLGQWYHLSTNMIDAGSRSAAAAGLYHFTVKPGSNVKEGTDPMPAVDIGFHFVAVDSNNLPIDTDQDGLPDYVEDRNGNGSHEPDEASDWQLADTDGDGLGDLQQIELSYNMLVNDPDQDYGNEQDTQFESACAVLNGNVVVAYVDSNQGVYGLGQHAGLLSRTPRLVGYAVSRDDGATFEDKGAPPLSTQDPATAADDGDAGDPVLAVDKSAGAIYLTGTSPRNAGWKGIPIWKSTDGGVTFGPPISVRSDIQKTDKPWIAVDNGDGPGQHDVYLAFTTITSPFSIVLETSADGDLTQWTAHSVVREADGTGVTTFNSPIVLLAPNHVGYVFWFERTGDGVNWLKMRQVQNRGAALGDIQTVCQLVTTNPINGNLQLKRSNNTTSDDAFRVFPFPVPGVNPDLSKAGHLYVAYADQAQNPDPNDRADVFLVGSTNGGVSWTSPVRVSVVPDNDQWMPVLAVKPDGAMLFIGWYDRRNDPDNSLIDVYGRWGTIAADGTVSLGTEFRITTTNFPPVFAGNLAENKIDGHYDPVYPPGGVNLHWWYPEWPAPPPPSEPDFSLTPNQAYEGHVGEYNGAWADKQYVYVTWTDNRLTAAGTLYARNQSDIRLLRLTWPQ